MYGLILKNVTGRKTASNPQYPSPAARRARRGFSLAEMGLVLIVISFLVQTGIEVATNHTKRQLTQRAAANLSQIADDIQTYLDRTYFNIRAELQAAPSGVIEKSWSSLIAARQVSLSSAPVSPDGGQVRLFFTLRGDAVYAVLMSFGGRGSVYSPRPDPSTRFAGKVNAGGSTTLRGWDFSLDIPEIASLSGSDLSGNIGVIRYVSQTVNVDPYLHRIEIPGRPDLNQMEANLDMGGFDIRNANTISSDRIQIQDSLSVAGRISAGDIVSSGDANFSELIATTSNVTNLTAGNMDVTGQVTTNSLVTTGMEVRNVMNSPNASFRNLVAETFSGGTVYLETGNFIRIDANQVNANDIIADRVLIGD